MDGKDIVNNYHTSQHYRIVFNRRTGFFMRIEDKGYNEPFWAEDGPELLDFSITNYCERECSFCYRNSSRIGSHVSLEDALNVIYQAKELGVLQMALGGGNPNQHPLFVKILKLIDKCGIVPSYTSSGMGLTDDVLKATLDYCGAMALSVYEPHSRDFAKQIELIVSYGIKLNLHIILRDNNIDFINEWLEMPPQFLQTINAVIFLNYKPINYNSEIKDNSKWEKFWQLVHNCKFINIGFDSCSVSGIVSNMPINSAMVESCEAARFSAFVSEDLKMYPCSFMTGTNIYGDLRKTSMLDIWRNNQAFIDFRYKIINNQCVQCKMKKLCNGGCQYLPQINLCDIHNPP